MVGKGAVLIVLLCTLAASYPAAAQAPGYSDRPYYGYGGGYGGYGGYGYGGYGHASTIAQGYGMGLSAVIQAQGQYNLMSSQAMIALEEARKKDLENRLKTTQTYFEMRRINKESREAERGPAPAPEDWVRYAHAMAPKPLTEAQLDRMSGTLQWPSILQGDAYAAQRDELDALFTERADLGGSPGALNAEAVHKAAQAMLNALRNQIKDYTPGDYLVARKFIEGLDYEARAPQHPAG